MTQPIDLLQLVMRFSGQPRHVLLQPHMVKQFTVRDLKFLVSPLLKPVQQFVPPIPLTGDDRLMPVAEIDDLISGRTTQVEVISALDVETDHPPIVIGHAEERDALPCGD